MPDQPKGRYTPIAINGDIPVVVENAPSVPQIQTHQSEAQMEADLIKQLAGAGNDAGLGYKYVSIKTEADLVNNLRKRLEILNDYEFSDTEWERLFKGQIANQADTVQDRTARIHESPILLLDCDDGSTRNIHLIDEQDIHNNYLQVINQYAPDGGKYKNRYDVTILVNGLPMVHLELKRRGLAIKEAFNQIARYGRDSFWAGNGLFDYVQLFVISNGESTKYYSNTTRQQHVDDQAGRSANRSSSASFEFTSYWADTSNKQIRDIRAFASTFLSKHTLLNVLLNYSVLTADQQLLVMRPYQITATERILQKIKASQNYKTLGTTDAGGYVWHTTGSGKTLTSFKAAQLATKLDGIKKVIFVVDRKDLDYQTVKEYQRFEKGSVNSNTSTKVLQRQINDPNVKIIVTTIQKLSHFVAANKKDAIYQDHVVFIFDEAHRSQFGKMHAGIRKTFKNYNLFGFTGTPILAQNAKTEGKARTTEDLFGPMLHAYNIVDAIEDGNVLPFRVDYNETTDQGQKVEEKQLLAPERIEMITADILENFDKKTRRNRAMTIQGKRQLGFNALFATASIQAAKAYYQAFKEAQADIPEDQRLKVALIYSYAPNPDDWDTDEDLDTSALSTPDRDFLEAAIADYNQMFKSNYSTDSAGFEKYYKDVSDKTAKREIDLLIVVNMFLTGFDAKTLNTLYVDKQLQSHGLLQAYSRTNRILNDVKSYGNIVSYRDLRQATDEALELFGNKNARTTVLLKEFDEYFSDYAANVSKLQDTYPTGENILGEQAKKDFARLFGSILRLRNILESFDEFEDNDILSPGILDSYRSMYLDIRDELGGDGGDDEDGKQMELVFEIELIKQIEVNVDYIVRLIADYQEDQKDETREEMRRRILAIVDASPSLRPRRDLFDNFISNVDLDESIDEQWDDFVNTQRQQELDQIITEENLQGDVYSFVESAFREGSIPQYGTAITDLLPPLSRFTPNRDHGNKKTQVIDRLSTLLERFIGLGGWPPQ
ncbi:type I restriction endonuclease subunit R [Actinomyces minihominis]|uniref:type I restriction endonuclease subunit R n=1 Tax=Actinomyces minihominis TaxID=2002838 RepID=UPI000C086C40|nr:type I restriction endonuclease subunit R [Actinomyces minihominis]